MLVIDRVRQIRLASVLLNIEEFDYVQKEEMCTKIICWEDWCDLIIKGRCLVGVYQTGLVLTRSPHYWHIFNERTLKAVLDKNRKANRLIPHLCSSTLFATNKTKELVSR